MKLPVIGIPGIAHRGQGLAIEHPDNIGMRIHLHLGTNPRGQCGAIGLMDGGPGQSAALVARSSSLVGLGHMIHDGIVGLIRTAQVNVGDLDRLGIQGSIVVPTGFSGVDYVGLQELKFQGIGRTVPVTIDPIQVIVFSQGRRSSGNIGSCRECIAVLLHMGIEALRSHSQTAPLLCFHLGSGDGIDHIGNSRLVIGVSEGQGACRLCISIVSLILRAQGETQTPRVHGDRRGHNLGFRGLLILVPLGGDDQVFPIGGEGFSRCHAFVGGGNGQMVTSHRCWVVLHNAGPGTFCRNGVTVIVIHV